MALTVSIFINNNPIHTRSCINTGRKDPRGWTVYEVDTGDVLLHRQEDGAVALAKKLLGTIQELKSRG